MRCDSRGLNTDETTIKLGLCLISYSLHGLLPFPPKHVDKDAHTSQDSTQLLLLSH